MRAARGRQKESKTPTEKSVLQALVSEKALSSFCFYVEHCSPSLYEGDTDARISSFAFRKQAMERQL